MYEHDLLGAPDSAFFRGLFAFLAGLVALDLTSSVVPSLLWIALVFAFFSGSVIWIQRARRSPKRIIL